MAPCGDGKLLFCVLFLSCCIATLAQRPMECCTDVSRKTIERRSVVDYCRQFQGQHGCSIDAVILVTRHGKKFCVTTDSLWLRDVMRHRVRFRMSIRRKEKKRIEFKHCFGVNTESDPEPTALHSPAMTTPPTLTLQDIPGREDKTGERREMGLKHGRNPGNTGVLAATLALGPVAIDCCTDVSRTTIDRRSVVDYRGQVKGQGCAIDAVIFVTRRGRNICVATDLPWLSDVMRHVDDLEKGCKEGRYNPKRCFGVKRV